MYTLLKSQKNEVFEIIQKVGMEPANFSWQIIRTRSPFKRERTKESVNEIPRLIYKNSRFYFQFELKSGTHSCVFSPGWDTPSEERTSPSWLDLISVFKQWLYNLKREIVAPDLWAEMGKYHLVVSSDIPENVKDEAFSWKEAEEIAEKLNLLGDEVKKIYRLNSEQDHFVRYKLNYLADAAKQKHFNCKDWMFLSLGVFQIVAWGLTLTPEQIKQLGSLIKTFLGGFIHFLGK